MGLSAHTSVADSFSHMVEDEERDFNLRDGSRIAVVGGEAEVPDRTLVRIDTHGDDVCPAPGRRHTGGQRQGRSGGGALHPVVVEGVGGESNRAHLGAAR